MSEFTGKALGKIIGIFLNEQVSLKLKFGWIQTLLLDPRRGLYEVQLCRVI